MNQFDDLRSQNPGRPRRLSLNEYQANLDHSNDVIVILQICHFFVGARRCFLRQPWALVALLSPLSIFGAYATPWHVPWP